jgi:orotidine-5'-phosphate decarboxylase
LTGRDRLILALDVAEPEAALELARRTAPHVGVFKASPAHLYREGAGFIARLKERGRPVFLDLKLYDIPATVARLTAEAARLGVDYLTVHVSGGSRMLAAARAVAGEKLRLLGVTVLTSFDRPQLAREWGLTEPVEERVLAWAELAREAGLHGIVCSPLELPAVRARFGSSLTTVVPGIRGPGDAPGDQTRTLGPAEAVVAGADFVVVGRPIVEASDPAEAALRFATALEGARP